MARQSRHDANGLTPSLWFAATENVSFLTQCLFLGKFVRKLFFLFFMLKCKKIVLKSVPGTHAHSEDDKM